MKKVFFLIFVFLLGFGVVVHANSAPVAVHEYENYEIVPISDDQVSIIRENLVFDFSANERGIYSPIAKVSADYLMKNDGEDKVVKMGFPLVSDYEKMRDPDLRRVTANGTAINPEVWIGPASRDSFRDYSENMDDFVTAEYRLESEIEGTLFRAYFDWTKIRLQFTSEHRFFIGENIGSLIEGNEIEFRMSGYPSYFIYVIGPEITVVEEEGLIDTRRMNGEEFVSFLEGRYVDELAQGLLSYQLDDFLQSEQRILEIQDVFENPRCFLLVYDVLLLGGGVDNEITVNYEMEGDYNSFSAITRYDYYTKPAKNWASFQNLTVTVIPSESAPYLLDSNYDFQKQEDGSYRVFLETLPDQDLHFSISKTEKPYYQTWFIRQLLNGLAYIIAYLFENPLLFIIFIALLILILLFFIFVVISVVKRMRRRV
jgi:hypothetical protein